MPPRVSLGAVASLLISRASQWRVVKPILYVNLTALGQEPLACIRQPSESDVPMSVPCAPAFAPLPSVKRSVALVIVQP